MWVLLIKDYSLAECGTGIYRTALWQTFTQFTWPCAKACYVSSIQPSLIHSCGCIAYYTLAACHLRTQDEVIALKRELRQREAQLSRKDREVADLRAQVAAGSFML